MPNKKIKVYDLNKIEEIKKEMNASLSEDNKIYWTGILAHDGAYDVFGIEKLTFQPVLDDKEVLWEDLREIHRVINKELSPAFETFKQRINKEALLAEMTPEELEGHRK